MRCLALAQAWQAMCGEVVFIAALGSVWLEERLRLNGIKIVDVHDEPGSIEDAENVVLQAKKLGAKWIAVDGYVFGSKYQQVIKDGGPRLLVIDDIGHSQSYCADIVLNQNAHASEDLYSKKTTSTKLLLGTKYLLLRREFLKWRDWKRNIPKVAHRLLIALGGGDSKNLTLRILKAFPDMRELEIVVVIGYNNPHMEELEDYINRATSSITLKTRVEDMAQLMSQSDMAVTSGGSSVWELAFMGAPSIVGRTVDAEKFLVDNLNAIGLFSDAGRFDDERSIALLPSLISTLALDQTLRKNMSIRARQIVDGFGQDRVVAAMMQTH